MIKKKVWAIHVWIVLKGMFSHKKTSKHLKIGVNTSFSLGISIPFLHINGCGNIYYTSMGVVTFTDEGGCIGFIDLLPGS